jgi:hypothetical protein
MSWSWDHTTGNLVHSDGQTNFTEDEWDRQVFPGCPRCGQRPVVEALRTRGLGPVKVIMGRISLPCGHDPRVAQ